MASNEEILRSIDIMEKQMSALKISVQRILAPAASAAPKPDSTESVVPAVAMAVASSPQSIFLAAIQRQKEKEAQQDIWADSPYRDLMKLTINNRGNVGEEFIDKVCCAAGIPANCDGSKTKKIGGGDGDGKINGMTVEVKTAYQGSGSPTFQHELGEIPWRIAKYMIFLDIAPKCMYLTIFQNYDEATYKSQQKLPYCFRTKSVCWRKGSGDFKLDTSVSINEQNVVAGNTIKIDGDTPMDAIADYIRAKIVA